MKVTRRLAELSPSPTMAVMQQAMELRRQGIDVIDLGPGEPDFPTPSPIKEAGRQAIARDFTRYTPAAGTPELRAAVARKFSRSGGPFASSHVLISNGAKQAIYNVAMALFEEGDEVLLPVPYWVTFPEVVRLTGARPRALETRAQEGFLLQAARVEEALGPRTRGLIVNTPNNPTGAVLSPDALRDLVELARARDLFLLFDETYEQFTYEGRTHASLSSFVGPEEKCWALVGSVSKTYAMTGWRIGYVLANQELIERLSAFQSHQSGNPCSISQQAALAALGSPDELVEAMRSEYARRRRLVVRELGSMPGFCLSVPYGAFYVFPNVEECMARLGLATSAELASFLIREARVATVPGSAFGLEGHLRISYATSVENLERAFVRIRSALETRSAAD